MAVAKLVRVDDDTKTEVEAVYDWVLVKVKVVEKDD